MLVALAIIGRSLAAERSRQAANKASLHDPLPG